MYLQNDVVMFKNIHHMFKGVSQGVHLANE
jgi:hypothetical protein